MSPRVLSIMALPLAVLGWAAVLLFTAAAPPSLAAYVIVLPLTALAVTMTVAVPLWLVARALHVPGTGQRPALALRAAAWVGLWSALVVALRLASFPVLGPAAGLAVVLGLFETFLLQANAGATRASSAAARPASKPKSSK